MDRKTLCALALMAVGLSSCNSGPKIVVGSKNFTEQFLLGEIAAQQIERRLHANVVRKFDLGGTLIAHQALRGGEIDLYPEYTGTALTAILKQAPAQDPKAVLASVRAMYRPYALTWLSPLGFNNTFAMVIRKQDADQRHVRTLSEAAAAGQWKLGVGYEFVKRPDGLTGLEKAYAIDFQGSVKQMDLGLLYPALDQHQIDMAAGNSTDGQLSARPLTVLDDDKRYFPPYEAAYVVRSDLLRVTPGLQEALEALSGKITTEAMQRMNYELDGRHRPAREIAKEFLDRLR